MAGFSHPNLVAVYDVEPGDPLTGREPLYVMEYCPGGSLADQIADGGSIPAEVLVPAIGSVADGLEALHAAGFIHRDVKPHNILFAGGRAKLADFGVAKGDPSEAERSLTLPGSMVGTWAFLAPELVAGDAASVASDVYALGVTTFLGLTGQYPETAAQPVSAVAPELGTAFDSALARALDEDPAARSSPHEFANELAKAVDTQTVGAGVALVAHILARSRVPPAIDPAAQTIVARPIVEPVSQPLAAPPPLPERPAPVAAPAGRDLARPSSASRTAAIVAAVVLIALAIAAAALALTGGPGPISAPTPTTRPAAASPTVAGPVLAALDRVDAAIEAVKGGKDGLSGKDANELAQLAGLVRTAVARRDAGAARAAASSLADRAGALSKGLDAERRQSLLDAIDALLKAL